MHDIIRARDVPLVPPQLASLARQLASASESFSMLLLWHARQAANPFGFVRAIHLV